MSARPTKYYNARLIISAMYMVHCGARPIFGTKLSSPVKSDFNTPVYRHPASPCTRTNGHLSASSVGIRMIPAIRDRLSRCCGVYTPPLLRARPTPTTECCGCIIIIVAYVFAMPLSWVFSRVLFLESDVALAAACLITVSIFVRMAIDYAVSTFCCTTTDGLGAQFTVMSGILYLVGCGLLVAAMVEAPHAQLDNPVATISCGAIVAVFTFIMAITKFLEVFASIRLHCKDSEENKYTPIDS